MAILILDVSKILLRNNKHQRRFKNSNTVFKHGQYLHYYRISYMFLNLIFNPLPASETAKLMKQVLLGQPKLEDLS
jgi:hypothetical protein